MRKGSPLVWALWVSTVDLLLQSLLKVKVVWWQWLGVVDDAGDLLLLQLVKVVVDHWLGCLGPVGFLFLFFIFIYILLFIFR